MIGVIAYVLEGGDNPKPIVQNNRDLIITDFDEHVHQVFISRTLVPHWHSVRSNQMDGFEYSQRSNLQTSEGDWYSKELEMYGE